ncbi:MAG: protein-disulfide reductase DsbD family protein, partial [Planctomycetota bacterium]
QQVFEVSAGAKAGPVTVQGKVNYMACTPEFCLPVMDAPFSAKLEIQAGAAPEKNAKKQDTKSVHQGDRARIEAVLVPATARAGEFVTLELRGEVNDGYHLYGAKQDLSLPAKLPTIEFDKNNVVSPIGRLELPPGEPHDVPAWGGTFHFIAGKFVFKQKLTVPKGAEPGKIPVRFHIKYQACDDATCQDGEDDLALELVVEAGAARAAHAADTTGAAGAGRQGETSDPFQIGLLAFILASIGGGLLALVMPCTYPMIPITMSYFTKQAEHRQGKVLPLALTYGAGIVMIFVLCALLVGNVIVPFAQNAWVNLAFGLVFVYFGLALLGVIEIRPPQFLMRAASSSSGRGGYVGVFLMGMTLVVATFACTVPIVGPLLVAGAEGENLGRVVLGMAVFGFTMAVPFVVLALLPGRMQAMPKAGQWMNTIKVFFGFVELAAALKFFSNSDLRWHLQVLPRELFLTLWFGIFLVAALYLLGMIRVKGETGEIGAGRLVWGTIVFLLALYFGHGAMGYKLDNWIMYAFEPPYSGETRTGSAGTEGEVKKKVVAASHTIVKDDYDAALARAKADGKKVFVNFTGVT